MEKENLVGRKDSRALRPTRGLEKTWSRGHIRVRWVVAVSTLERGEGRLHLRQRRALRGDVHVSLMIKKMHAKTGRTRLFQRRLTSMT